MTISFRTPPRQSSSVPASDTSDFLQQAELFNNGHDGSVTSSVGHRPHQPGCAISSSAGLRTPLTARHVHGQRRHDQLQPRANRSTRPDQRDQRQQIRCQRGLRHLQTISSSSVPAQRGPQIHHGRGRNGQHRHGAAADHQPTASSSVGQPTLFSDQRRGRRARAIHEYPDLAASSAFTGRQLHRHGHRRHAAHRSRRMSPPSANAINAFVSTYNTTQGLDRHRHLRQSRPTRPRTGPLATDSNLTFLAPQLRESDQRLRSTTASADSHAQRPGRQHQRQRQHPDRRRRRPSCRMR